MSYVTGIGNHLRDLEFSSSQGRANGGPKGAKPQFGWKGIFTVWVQKVKNLVRNQEMSRIALLATRGDKACDVTIFCFQECKKLAWEQNIPLCEFWNLFLFKQKKMVPLLIELTIPSDWGAHNPDFPISKTRSLKEILASPAPNWRNEHAKNGPKRDV